MRKNFRKCKTHPRPPKSEITWEESCDERSAALQQISLLIVSAFLIFKQNVVLSLSHFVINFAHDILIIFNFE